MVPEADRAAGVQPLEIRTGNKLLDQFHSYYWSIAFCFLFPYATAGPDVHKTAALVAARFNERSAFLVYFWL